MSLFCQDKDLLLAEPSIFLSGSHPAQDLATGSDGTLSGSTFSSPEADFVAAGAQPGMVLVVSSATLPEGVALEIVTADTATILVVSVVRPDAQTLAVTAAGGSNMIFRVRTFRAQIAAISAALSERLRHVTETSGLTSADFADSDQLRQTTAAGTLSAVFAARAVFARSDDPNWSKAEHYRKRFNRLQDRLRLSVDADGDGTAEATRTLGHIHLRRQ